MEQIPHANGFSPVWDLEWYFKPLLWEKDLGQNSQWKGFSPVCRRLCLSNWLAWTNVFGQKSQAKGFDEISIKVFELWKKSFRVNFFTNVEYKGKEKKGGGRARVLEIGATGSETDGETSGIQKNRV